MVPLDKHRLSLQQLNFLFEHVKWLFDLRAWHEIMLLLDLFGLFKDVKWFVMQ